MRRLRNGNQQHTALKAPANLGANMLAEMCRQAEDRYHESQEKKQVMLDAIFTELSRVRDFIDVQLSIRE